MKKKIENTNPIKITIPSDLYNLLKQDAENFEVFKNGNAQFVINHILSLIIAGYYEQYQEMISGQYKRMQALLSSYVGNSQKLNEIINTLIEDKAANESPEFVRGKTKAISFRPTSETDDIIPLIDRSMQETQETQAGYYRRMLSSYSKLPMYERERVLNYKSVSILEKACDDEQEVVFSIRNKHGSIHRVIPYKIVHGLNERQNYLLCQEYDSYREQQIATSYRLCRIVNPRTAFHYEKIQKSVKEFLEKMEKYGPQYSINEDIETCVELNESGQASFRSIFNERPIYTHVDVPDESGTAKYYFRCSQNQLYLYFRRFNPGEARIIEPKMLQEKLLEFHSKHVVELQKQLSEKE